MLKVLAFYLPQYHSIPENDQWWGQGFTEWTNLRKAKPLYPGHYQPRTPYQDNYYNLLDPETRQWQADLAKKYGIYGFCYYHYWFNGKGLLEKPINAVLQSGEPDLPFCLCWANEPWTRAWDGKVQETLMPQEYGDDADWITHFNYLLKAFKDKRYIKVGNRPLLVIYRMENIPCHDAMIALWNQLAKNHGFDGIHLVEMLNGFQNQAFCKYSKALVEFEPMYTLAHDKPNWLRQQRKLYFSFKRTRLGALIFQKEGPDCFNYNLIWRQINKRKHIQSSLLVYPGAFVDWDNTPRRGSAGLAFRGASPRKFGRYIKKQFRKVFKEQSEFVFINAWNEWAEGTYLEPDRKFGFGYLEAIQKALNDLEN